LLLFAPNLSGGGAERVLARLANHWAEALDDVTVVTLADVSDDDFPLSPNVRRIALGLTGDSRGLIGAFCGNWRRVATLRRVLRETRPDVVVSFIEQANVLALLAARPLPIPVVISERTDPSRHRAGRVWEFLRRYVYHRCTALVVLTDDIARQLRPIVRNRPVVVIPNGVAAPDSRTSLTERKDLLVAIGRLDAAKGYDRLLEAFARAAARNRSWRLTIVGEGPLREDLERQTSQLRLDDRVQFPGRLDPASELASASIFALTSRYEGFPNALLEAMAAGVPAVAFDGSSAVRQIIRDGVDGLLVPDGDVSGFAEALSRLISDDDQRRAMGEAARDVVNRFSLDDFFRRWDDVVATAANQKNSQPSRGKSE